MRFLEERRWQGRTKHCLSSKAVVVSFVLLLLLISIGCFNPQLTSLAEASSEEAVISVEAGAAILNYSEQANTTTLHGDSNTRYIHQRTAEHDEMLVLNCVTRLQRLDTSCERGENVKSKDLVPQILSTNFLFRSALIDAHAVELPPNR